MPENSENSETAAAAAPVKHMWWRRFAVLDPWDIDLGRAQKPRRFLVKTMRLLHMAVNEFIEGELNLRAMSLVYTTLLSFVPVIAVSFSVLKAFGIHNQIVPFLQNLLAPFGSRSFDIANKIKEFVDKVSFGVLGYIGLFLLLFLILMLIQKIESAFNFIWKIKRPRGIVRRITDYMTLLLLGPVFLFSIKAGVAKLAATTVAGKIMSLAHLGVYFFVAAKALDFLSVCAIFMFIYVVIPNTRVRLTSAFAGAVFAAFLWKVSKWMFTSFVVSSSHYDAVYSGMGLPLMFMIWLYLGWIILLVGARAAYLCQYPQSLDVRYEKVHLSGRMMERFALVTMFHIAQAYHEGHRRPDTDWLVKLLAMPVENVTEMLDILIEKGLIAETADDPSAYLPARDIANITVMDVFQAVRTAGETHTIGGAAPGVTVEKFNLSAYAPLVAEKIDHAFKNALGDETLRDIVIATVQDSSPGNSDQTIRPDNSDQTI
jgi:membrane protein